MKKSLIALAALAAVTAASAQSTVTISGTFGAGYQSNEVGALAAVAAVTASSTADGVLGTKATTAATSEGLVTTDASIKFTATEDLGGGLKATAAAQFATNELRGGGLTKEDTSIALSGGFGSLTIGNSRSSDAAIMANVFASWMPVTSFYATVSSRVDIDLISYTTPAILPGLTATVTSAELTEGKTKSVTQSNGIAFNYTQGPLAAVVGFKTTNGLTTTQLTTTEKNNTELAVTYDLGVAKVGLGFDSASLKGTSSNAYGEKSLISYGVNVPMGAFTVGYNGAKRGVNKFYDAGVSYDLSKRTSIKAMVGKLTNTSSASTVASNAGTQYRVGGLHNF